MSQPPLCIDLNGPLIAIDTLRECLRTVVREKPWLSPLLALYLLRGRAAFKACLAQIVELEPDGYPIDGKLLNSYSRSGHAGIG
jgi:hypothetical protein